MIAFDTNVLIYACDKSRPDRQTRAFDLISNTTDGVLLWQVACEFLAAARKLAGQGFTAEAAWARLREYMAIMPLVLPGPQVLDHAETLSKAGWSFWDALILGACLEAEITTLYSEDLPGREPPIKVINPFV